MVKSFSIINANKGFKCKWAVWTLPTAACRGECPHSPPILSLNPWYA